MWLRGSISVTGVGGAAGHTPEIGVGPAIFSDRAALVTVRMAVAVAIVELAGRPEIGQVRRSARRPAVGVVDLAHGCGQRATVHPAGRVTGDHRPSLGRGRESHCSAKVQHLSLGVHHDAHQGGRTGQSMDVTDGQQLPGGRQQSGKSPVSSTPAPPAPIINRPAGFTGSAGLTEWTGFAGSAGFSGSVGLTGSTGITGSAGLTEWTGFAGSTGFTGSAGFSGSAGLTEWAGFGGSAGLTGAVGFTGSAGLAGWIRLTESAFAGSGRLFETISF
jgi:hypothetical protein